MIRSLIYYDDFFVNTILNKKVYSLVSSILDDTCILHLQNENIQYILICANPIYFKFIKKKIGNKKYKILFPFNVK